MFSDDVHAQDSKKQMSEICGIVSLQPLEYVLQLIANFAKISVCLFDEPCRKS